MLYAVAEHGVLAIDAVAVLIIAYRSREALYGWSSRAWYNEHRSEPRYVIASGRHRSRHHAQWQIAGEFLVAILRHLVAQAVADRSHRFRIRHIECRTSLNAADVESND
jgi:hypothetical protein